MLQSWKILQSDQGQDTSTIFQRQTEVKIGSVQTLIAMEPRTNESTSLKLFHVHCSIFYLYCLSLTEDAFSNSSLPENFHSRISDFIGRKNKWNWSHFSFQFKCRKKISDHFVPKVKSDEINCWSLLLMWERKKFGMWESSGAYRKFDFFFHRNSLELIGKHFSCSSLLRISQCVIVGNEDKISKVIMKYSAYDELILLVWRN